MWRGQKLDMSVLIQCQTSCWWNMIITVNTGRPLTRRFVCGINLFIFLCPIIWFINRICVKGLSVRTKECLEILILNGPNIHTNFPSIYFLMAKSTRKSWKMLTLTHTFWPVLYMSWAQKNLSVWTFQWWTIRHPLWIPLQICCTYHWLMWIILLLHLTTV